MKIKIEYKFSTELIHPFVAFTNINGHYVSGWDDYSFDQARNNLLSKVRELETIVPTIIPEPEEVEVA